MLFGIGVVAILFSARLFLLAAQQLSARLRISPLLVGTVVMAIASTLPELSVTLTATSNQDSGLALGNSVGSVIVNLGLLFGIAILAGSVRIGTKKTQIQAILIAVAALMLSLLIILKPSVDVQSFVALLSGALLFGVILFLAWLGRNHEDISVLKDLMRRLRKHQSWKWPKILVSIAVSTVGLWIGSSYLFEAVEGFSLLFGISTTVLGLTITSLTTSLPEIALTIMSGRAKEEKALVGALVGSSAITLTFLPALIAWRGFPLELPLFDVSWLLILITIFLLTIVRNKGKVVSKKYGFALIATWAIFVVATYIFG